MRFSSAVIFALVLLLANPLTSPTQTSQRLLSGTEVAPPPRREFSGQKAAKTNETRDLSPRDRRAADLNLPADFVQRLANRSTMDRYAGQFHAFDGELRPEAYRPVSRGTSRSRFVRLVRPNLTDTVLKYRLAQQRVEEPLRGFRAPILGDAERRSPATLVATALNTEQRAAADLIQRRLAHDGLLLTLARVLQTLGPEKFRTADPESVATLWAIGFPVDWLAYFQMKQTQAADPRGLISFIAGELADNQAFAATEAKINSAQFRFAKSRADFRVASESGEAELAMLRMQIGGGYQSGIVPGDSIDLTSQLVAALPDVKFTLSVPAEFATNLLWIAQNCWPLRHVNHITMIAEPYRTATWAQDNGKAGTVGSPGPGVMQPALLAPRFASQEEDRSIFFPGESYLMDGVQAAGIEVIPSPLHFQGGNVMAVREPATGKRVLLIGEAEIYRNTALGLTRAQVLEAFRIEFDVDSCIIFPVASHHLDLDVSVRASDNQLIAFVNDPLAAARVILECGLAGFESYGTISAADAVAVRQNLKIGNDAEVVKLLTGAIRRAKSGRDRFPLALAQSFRRESSDWPVANVQCFLACVDVLASTIATEREAQGDERRRRYLACFLELEEALARQRSVLASLGWKVVRVPSLPDLFRSINYLNGVHDRTRFIMPAFGGFYAAVDQAAMKSFQQELGPAIKIVPILCAAAQADHGGVHCTASAYPRP